MSRINVLHGDITKIPVQAIVNAANTSLLGGGGVDGAIHRSGGSQILAECRTIRNRQGGCKTGEAVITTAGKLSAEYVIHTVGPHWYDGNHDENKLLKSAYKSCFDIIKEYNIRSVSFPNISTGIYKFPKALAADIALETIFEEIKYNPHLEDINLVCFDNDNYKIYYDLLNCS